LTHSPLSFPNANRSNLTFVQIICIPPSPSILDNPIEYLKGVGPQKADLLKKELGIFTFGDLLEHFPLRHLDRTSINKIAEIEPSTEYAQVAGILDDLTVLGDNRSKRLIAHLRDRTGTIELCWFQGIHWAQKSLVVGKPYLVFGRTAFFNGKAQMSHPELELYETASTTTKEYLEPIYPTTEKLKARALNGKQIGKLTGALISMLSQKDIQENLPVSILKSMHLVERFNAYLNIHFPKNANDFSQALERLKFEELFLAQVRLGLTRLQRNRYSKGVVFEKVGTYFNEFYKKHLPFELTNAQKRVIKE
jgi:ATP-dependent DNA helicase RecG